MVAPGCLFLCYVIFLMLSFTASFSVFAGLADIFGLGSHPFPQVPYFGPWQAAGVLVGQGILKVGFVMMIPYRHGKG